MEKSFSRALYQLTPRRLAWVSGLMAFTMVALCVGLFYLLGVRDHQRKLGEHARDLASLAATTVDVAAHARLRDPAQTGSPEHLRLLEPLVAIHQRIPEIHYLYTTIYQGDRKFFILDTAQDPRIAAWPDTVGCPVMDEFKNPHPNEALVRQTLESGQPYVFPDPYEDSFGRFITAFAPLMNADGQLEGYLGVDLRIDVYDRTLAYVRNIALAALGVGLVCSAFLGWLSGSLRVYSIRQLEERARAEVEARRAQQKAEEALQSKQELLSIAAHDLKNPLSAIIGVADMTDQYIQQVPPRYIPDTTRGLFHKIPHYAHNMLRIIEEVLRADKIERIGMHVDDEPFNASEVAAEVVEFNRFNARKKRITIHYVCERAYLVRGDRDRVMEALDNLISNAVKYSPRGSRVDVALGCDLKQTRLRFSVTDEGPGLSDDDQEKLFQKFQKLSAKPTAGESSTGLGLSIVKHIIEAHGGSVACESESGFGATFIVELPIVGARPLYEKLDTPADKPEETTATGKRKLSLVNPRPE